MRRVIRIWREQPVLQRRKFFQGRAIRGSDIKDISLVEPSGKEMSDEDWAGFVRCLGVRLAGDRIDEVDERGEPIVGDTLLLLLNAHHERIPFALPATQAGQHWERLFDTADDRPPEGRRRPIRWAASLAVFRTRRLVAGNRARGHPAGSPARRPVLAAAMTDEQGRLRRRNGRRKS